MQFSFCLCVIQRVMHIRHNIMRSKQLNEWAIVIFFSTFSLKFQPLSCLFKNVFFIITVNYSFLRITNVIICKWLWVPQFSFLPDFFFYLFRNESTTLIFHSKWYFCFLNSFYCFWLFFPHFKYSYSVANLIVASRLHEMFFICFIQMFLFCLP